MVGRVDMIEMDSAVEHYRAKGLDFSKVLYKVDENGEVASRCVRPQEHDFSLSLDDQLIEKSKDAIDKGKKVEFEQVVKNYNRTVGATLSGEVSKKYGSKGLPEDTLKINFDGSAGQSFGAFLAPGITFTLKGDANDYFGKGLSGGKLIVHIPEGSTFLPHKNIISGNVNLFGATSGEAYINGRAGERFCVRNSGAIAVVEGVGDHGCEYMTGGRVIVLGSTGVNFAAGMSGGIAYVLDETQLFDTRCNLEMVDIEPVNEKTDIQFLKLYIEKHYQYTASPIAKHIIDNWVEMLPYFVKVMPIDYRKALERIAQQKYNVPGNVGMTEEVF
jgi:glutamate synthase domain-containing protein 3